MQMHAVDSEIQVDDQKHSSDEPTAMPTADVCPEELVIPGITEPTILRYFDTLNSGDFRATAQLFAATGQLYPPFEEAIVGPEAIATYLETEARGMKLVPREGISQVVEQGMTEVKVTGKVQTPLFGVNVSWYFLLNEQGEILSVGVKLLAALEELLHLKR